MRVDQYRVDVYTALEYVDKLIDQGEDLDTAVDMAAKRYHVEPQEILEAYDGTY